MATQPTPSKSGIYVICLSDTHYYGGRSVDCPHRWRGHLADLVAGTHYNKRMQAVYNIHRRFEPTIVIPWSGGCDLKALEQLWLDDNFRKPGCVNLVGTADGGCSGHTEETCQKMSHTRKTDPELAPKLRAMLNRIRPLGIPFRWTPEARQKLRNRNHALIGIPQSPELVEKRAAAHRGRKNTEATIQLMSESAKRRCVEHPTEHGPRTRALISSQQKGRVWINNGVTNQRLWPCEAEVLLLQGWVPGRHRKAL